jgi:hypothetical protein
MRQVADGPVLVVDHLFMRFRFPMAVRARRPRRMGRAVQHWPPCQRGRHECGFGTICNQSGFRSGVGSRIIRWGYLPNTILCFYRGSHRQDRAYYEYYQSFMYAHTSPPERNTTDAKEYFAETFVPRGKMIHSVAS